jgi:hypothetical protein
MLIFFLITTTILGHKYHSARKFYGLITIFDKDSIKWAVINGYTLKFISEEYGEFYLTYIPEGSKLAYYRLGIISDSCGQYLYGNEKELWMRPTVLDTLLGIEPPQETEDISLQSINKVGALRKITLEKNEGRNWIVAQLDDRYLRSELEDLIRALKILKKIDNNFKKAIDKDRVFTYTIPSLEWAKEAF